MRIRIAAVLVLVALAVSLPAGAANYTDWCWGGSEQSGYGINVGQQANLVFVSWFTYDEAGSGMWVVFSGPLNATGHVATGKFYRTTGPALGTPFDPAKVIATEVGKGMLTFADMHHATFEWSVYGKSGTIALVRQTYGASTIAGNYDEGTTDGNRHCPGMPGMYGYPSDPTPRCTVRRRCRSALPAARQAEPRASARRRAAGPVPSTRADRPCACRHRVVFAADGIRNPRSHTVRARPRGGRLAEDDVV